MNFGSINWLAVVACVMVSMAVGFVWYNPKTFFPVWWKGIGKSESDVPGTGGAMGMTWTIEAGNHFVTFVLFGAILGAWR